MVLETCIRAISYQMDIKDNREDQGEAVYQFMIGQSQQVRWKIQEEERLSSNFHHKRVSR